MLARHVLRWILNTRDTQNMCTVTEAASQSHCCCRLIRTQRNNPGIFQEYYQMTRKEFALYISGIFQTSTCNDSERIRQAYSRYIPGIGNGLIYSRYSMSEYSRHIDLVVIYMEYSRNMSEYPTSMDSRCMKLNNNYYTHYFYIILIVLNVWPGLSSS